MKVFHINQFKCTLCSNWFCPPFNLPYRLKCTHSICTNCLEKSIQNKTNQIICPEDLESNPISQININHSTKKALERLLKQHKNFTQTNHLQCIKSLSINFDELLDSKEMQLKNLSTLIDQIFENQIRRLRQIYQKVKLEINRPFRIVNDWKEVVRNYLKKVKSCGPNMKGCVNELNHYIEEGRKIKLDLNEYLKQDFRQLIDHLLVQPQVCFVHAFSIFDKMNWSGPKEQFSSSLSKFETLGKKPVQNSREIFLHDQNNNFDQSSIRVNNVMNQPQQQSNKMSLFEELINETPKNSKHYLGSRNYDNSRKTPLKEIIFESSNNVNQLKSSNYNNNLEEKQAKEKIKNSVTGYELSQNCVSKYLEDNAEMEENSYSEKIKEKIKNLKTREERSNMKKSYNMGKSLEYSPEDINYSPDVTNNFYHEVDSTSKISHSLINNYRKMTLPQRQTLNQPMNQVLTSLSHHGNQASHQKIRIQGPNEMRIEEPDQIEEEMLLDQKSNQKPNNLNSKPKNDWQLEHLNFLKEWKINKNSKPQQQLEIVQKLGGYDCEKQKNKYAKKIEQHKVKELVSEIEVGDNYISLVGHSLANCNMSLFLSQINWSERNIEIVKLIKTSLSDQQFNILLNFLVRSQVHTLMLSYNNLSELSLDALLNFVEINQKVKNVYLSKNNISLLRGNARAKLNLLKEKGINMYI